MGLSRNSLNEQLDVGNEVFRGETVSDQEHEQEAAEHRADTGL